ncbi:hypothetical protein HPB51_012305 [Rhipicephalus microplus]|uniref:Uncharacterized protein n=1 Tax=Rhipicephalus microplus TaxID=6941 RepID=A0A9J6E9F6_RHIMP|nr:hypothetical protein HPB51_012305 [Rhipicephalus microplus]
MSRPPDDPNTNYNQPTPSTGPGQSSTENPAPGRTNYSGTSPQHIATKHEARSPSTPRENRSQQGPYSSTVPQSTQGPPRHVSGQTTPTNLMGGQAESKPGASTPQESAQHSFAAAYHRHNEQGSPSTGRRKIKQKAPGYPEYDHATLSGQELYKYPPKSNAFGRMSPLFPKSGRRSPPSPAASGRVPWRSLGYRLSSPKT